MQNSVPIDVARAVTPGLARRLAAIFYDSILVTALLLMAITLVVVPLDLIFGWENIDTAKLRLNPFYLAYLTSVAVGFHTIFWSRGGQTLGMRAWRLRVIRDDGLRLTFKDALLRYIAAIFSLATCGLGFLWVLVDKDRLAWHDRISKTRLIMVARRLSDSLAAEKLVHPTKQPEGQSQHDKSRK